MPPSLSIFIDGYDQSYDSTLSSESIEIILFRFEGSADASAFLRLAPQTNFITQLDHTTGAIATIPGSVLVDSTKAGNDGFYVHQILAQKNNIFMGLEYDTEAAGPTPPFVADFATQQFAAL